VQVRRTLPFLAEADLHLVNSAFLGVEWAMFPVDALGTVGIGVAGGVMQIPVDVLPIPEIQGKRSL